MLVRFQSYPAAFWLSTCSRLFRDDVGGTVVLMVFLLALADSGVSSTRLRWAGIGFAGAGAGEGGTIVDGTSEDGVEGTSEDGVEGTNDFSFAPASRSTLESSNEPTCGVPGTFDDLI